MGSEMCIRDRYLKKAPNLGMMFVMHPQDIDSFVISLRTDADHSNDAADARSTSGGIERIRGANGTSCPIGWWARRQGWTARSTPEAELQSLDDGVFTFALPLTGICEELVQREVRLIAELDASATLGAVAKGYSRKLGYMKKARRVSISALHEGIPRPAALGAL